MEHQQNMNQNMNKKWTKYDEQRPNNEPMKQFLNYEPMNHLTNEPTMNLTMNKQWNNEPMNQWNKHPKMEKMKQKWERVLKQFQFNN